MDDTEGAVVPTAPTALHARSIRNRDPEPTSPEIFQRLVNFDPAAYRRKPHRSADQTATTWRKSCMARARCR